MKLFTLTSILLDSTMAALGIEHRRARFLERLNHNSNPAQRPPASNSTTPPIKYINNWAGAVIETTALKSLTGTFTIPVITTVGKGAAWVGIDGNDCYTAILQTGIDWSRTGSTTTYTAWFEWYPDVMYNFSGFAMKAGDVIEATVNASSTTSGVATLNNLSTGKIVTHTWSSKDTYGTLCGTDAEWIVEDYSENFGLVTFADFGTVSFTGASAVTAAGTIGLDDPGAFIFDMQQESKIITNCSIPSRTSVECLWL